MLALRPPGFPTEGTSEEAATGLGDPNRVRIATVDHGRLAMMWGLRHGLRGEPLQVGMHRSAALARAFDRELERFAPDVVVLMLSRVGWLASRCGSLPVVVDLVDSLALNLRRRARQQPVVGALWRWEAQRMMAWDRDLVARTTAACLVGSDDRDAVVGQDAVEQDGVGNRALAEKVSVVPFGLSVPERSSRDPNASDAAPIVLLSGNLGYFPTVDAAVTFAEQVWPALRRAVPQASFWLAGARPARAIQRLAALPGVRVIANPPDLGVIRRQATVSIAPLRAGSGTPIKVLEAMADGLPVVTTRRGATGLEALPAEAISIADDPAATVDAIVRLLSDPSAAARQADAAFAWVQDRHDLTRVGDRFESLLAAACGR